MKKNSLLGTAARALKPLIKYHPVSNPSHQAWLSDSSNISHLEKLGVSRKELTRLKNLPHHFRTTTHLLDREIIVTSPFWYLHGLKELFIDETYKFSSDLKDPLIIDCGSNVGLSIIYFKQLYPEAKIIGFEPDPGLYYILTKNLDAFGFSAVTVFEKAVWTENTSLNFHSDGSVGGRLELQLNENGSEHTVEAVRLQEFLNSPVDFLKIDIEGPEDVVIEDCAPNLDKVEHLFIEYHSHPSKPQALDRILKTLSSKGFRYYIKEAWENMHHPFTQKKGIVYDLQLNIFAYRLEQVRSTN